MIKLLFILIVCLISCLKVIANDDALAIPIETKLLRHDTHNPPIHISGKLSRKTILRLAFNIGGLISSVNVDRGDVVAKGQMLATLDKKVILARMKEARSFYQTALNNWQRIDNLYKKNIIALSELQQSKSSLDSAESALKISEFDLSLSKISAPVSGEVIERFIEENELILAKKTAFIISSGKNGWVINVKIPDHDVVKISLGDSVDIKLYAYEGTIFKGTVSEIAAMADEKSSLFTVEVKLNDNLPTFRTGYLASVDIKPTNTIIYSYITLDSILDINDKKASFFAFDKTTQRVKKIMVNVAYLRNNEIVSLDPLVNITEIVTKGKAYLKDGDLVIKHISP